VICFMFLRVVATGRPMRPVQTDSVMGDPLFLAEGYRKASTSEDQTTGWEAFELVRLVVARVCSGIRDDGATALRLRYDHSPHRMGSHFQHEICLSESIRVRRSSIRWRAHQIRVRKNVIGTPKE
jgi:hypothetical protein